MGCSGGEGERGEGGGGEDEDTFGSFSDIVRERGSASERRGGFVDSREDFDFESVGRTVDFEGLRGGGCGRGHGNSIRSHGTEYRKSW